jgi:hypothetical protein
VNTIAANGNFSGPAFADDAAILYPDDLDLATLVTWIVVVQNLSDVKRQIETEAPID